MGDDWIAESERRVFAWLDRRKAAREKRARDAWSHCVECGTKIDDTEPPNLSGIRRWCSEDCRQDWQMGRY